MNQTLEGYKSRFRKNIFRPKYTDVVKTVQSYRIYRYVATSAKHFSVANMAKDSVVIATLILARRSKPSKIEVYRIKRERRMKDSQKKRITRNYHLLRRFESWKCCLVTAFICPNCRGIQTNTSNISLKKAIFLSPDIVK